MNVTIFPSKAIGTISAPPSKSYAHRLLICSALSALKAESNTKEVLGVQENEDVLASLDCIKALGIDFDFSNEGLVFHKNNEVESTVFPCRESGSTLRFFIPIALALKKTKVVFKGTQRLLERGIGVYEEVLKDKGITITKEDKAFVLEGALKGGTYTVKGHVSSQFISGFLFALPLLEEDSVLKLIPPVESKAYVDMTLETLKAFGIEIVQIGEYEYFIEGRQKYVSCTSVVEGDWSNGAFLLAFNHLGGKVEVKGLDSNSLQGDKVITTYLEALETENATIDISNCPDLGPILFATAAAKNGCRFTGTSRLRIKESNRSEVMAQELSKMGGFVEVLENEAIVHKRELHKSLESIDSHNDHRIAMAMAVLLSLYGGTIEGSQCVNKSYPNFWKDLQKLGLSVGFSKV
ncbi:MAG: 3-phosphoshikimate 1-carboxyvinyltransferase [Sphaerochaetaceae bacterium]|nr:3-phosphoshikimate 1-carboxyvinyltransferase [Sphaerochaetaceae bacterium]